MICPRCADEKIEVMATSPVKGVWTVYQCQHCLYTCLLYTSFGKVRISEALANRRQGGVYAPLAERSRGNRPGVFC